MIMADNSQLNTAARASLLQALATASLQRKVTPAADLGGVRKLLDADDLAVRCAALRAAGLWQREELRERISQTALDTGLDRHLRDAAIDGLTSLGGPAQHPVAPTTVPNWTTSTISCAACARCR